MEAALLALTLWLQQPRVASWDAANSLTITPAIGCIKQHENGTWYAVDCATGKPFPWGDVQWNGPGNMGSISGDVWYGEPKELRGTANGKRFVILGKGGGASGIAGNIVLRWEDGASINRSSVFAISGPVLGFAAKVHSTCKRYDTRRHRCLRRRHGQPQK